MQEQTYFVHCVSRAEIVFLTMIHLSQLIYFILFYFFSAYPLLGFNNTEWMHFYLKMLF